MTLGVIGGGQLARMLAEAAAHHGIDCAVYAQSATDSASYVLNNPSQLFVGSLDDESSLARFLSSVEVATFENEFLDTALLTRACPATCTIRPKVQTLELMQDKLKQKQLFAKLELPTADFQIVESTTQAKAIAADWGGAILKWSRFGYDGKGNLRIQTDDITPAEVDAFISAGHAKGATIYAEKLVPFVKEIAVQVARSDQQIRFFPVVVSEQQKSICHRVWGPAIGYGVNLAAVDAMNEFGNKLATHLKYEGVFAIEAFQTQNGDLLINELAPRVHNTGHATQSVCTESQFDLHVQAVTRRPLPEITLKAPYFAMLNLIGPEDDQALTRLGTFFAPTTSNASLQLGPQIPNVSSAVTWYGKSVRAGRKLGHINFWSDDQNSLNEAMARWEKWIYHGEN